MPSLKIFLDASVILSGLASPTGGSRKLLEAAKKRKIILIATPLVIEEATHHLQKLGIESNQLKTLFHKKAVLLTNDPGEKMIEKFNRICLDKKDAHVLAGATLSGANILVSLDKKHILTPVIRRSLKPILVKSPKEFWEWARKNLF